jgi:aryl-phospho-beta-D-glucosidase BglC (GH1 family)
MAPGAATFTVTATNAAGSSSKQLSVTANPAVTPASVLTTSPLPIALSGTVYSQTLAASGTTPITWTVTSGALPAGLRLESTGVLSGTLTTPGAATFTVTATNAAGSNSKQLSVTVNPAVTSPSILTTSALPMALTGTVYSQTLAASGTTPITWAVTSGTLPAGLSLGSTGILSGTLKGPMGASAFTVAATNAAGSSSKLLSLNVSSPGAPPTIVTAWTATTAFAGEAYSQAQSATGTTPMTWTITNGKLPPGLNLGLSTGLISGTPATLGVSTFTVTATNAFGSSSKQMKLTVNAPPTLPGAQVPPIGINMSEAEYSWGSFPGAIDLAYVKSNNMSLIRLPIAWERVQPTLGGTLDTAYLSGLRTFMEAASAQGLRVIVDVHNYGRYNRQWSQQAAANYGFVAVGGGDVIGSPAVPISAFADFWSKLAGALNGTPGLAYYDIMNEPYNMGAVTVWPSAAQAAVNAIRTVDTNTWVLVEGTQWASARWWPGDNGGLNITDPANKLLYEAHLYFDDGSGTYSQTYSDSGAYPNVGVDGLQPFLSWLKQHNAKGFVGEFGIPNNDPQWLPVLDKFLTVLQTEGLSGTYWNYTFHSATDPSWWPVADPMSIRVDNGQSNPQISVLSRSAMAQ